VDGWFLFHLPARGSVTSSIRKQTKKSQGVRQQCTGIPNTLISLLMSPMVTGSGLILGATGWFDPRAAG